MNLPPREKAPLVFSLTKKRDSFLVRMARRAAGVAANEAKRVSRIVAVRSLKVVGS
jgi:hypothetical protein